MGYNPFMKECFPTSFRRAYCVEVCFLEVSELGLNATVQASFCCCLLNTFAVAQHLNTVVEFARGATASCAGHWYFPSKG